MSLVITARTTDERLTSLAALKGELGIASSATSADDRLGAILDRASAWAQTYVGYPLVVRAYRETVPGFGRRNLMLARTPVRAVRALYFGTDTGTAQQIPSTEFDVDEGPGFLARPSGWDWSVPAVQDLTVRPQPGEELRPWLVDYVAGYALAGISTDSPLWSTEKGTTSTERTLPADIEEAVLLRAARTYRGLETVTAKSVGDLSITYAYARTLGKVADPAEDRLNPYRRSA